jgi:hypothetical protein
MRHVVPCGWKTSYNPDAEDVSDVHNLEQRHLSNLFDIELGSFLTSFSQNVI